MPKRRKAAPEKPADPFLEYGNTFPTHVRHDIMVDILQGDKHLRKLIEALHAFDQNGIEEPRPDKMPLIALLRSTESLQDNLLADLLERYNLVKQQHRPRRPVYLITEKHHKLLQGVYDVDDLRASLGISVAEAIDFVSKNLHLEPEELLNARQRRTRPFRKKK